MTSPADTLQPRGNRFNGVGTLARGPQPPDHPARGTAPLRMLLVLDNLAGHRTPALALWLFTQGSIFLYTPLSGSWLNLAESIQRVLKRRAIDGQYLASPAEIIAWLEAVAEHWNKAPTPFVWVGKRIARRKRECEVLHRVVGSGAETKKPLKRTRKCYGHAHSK